MDNSKENSNYTPIACAAYDIYEIAIMYQQILDLVWLDDEGSSRQDLVLAQDLRIINGAEYLVAQRLVDGAAAEPFMIRLDKIKTAKAQEQAKPL